MMPNPRTTDPMMPNPRTTDPMGPTGCSATFMFIPGRHVYRLFSTHTHTHTHRQVYRLVDFPVLSTGPTWCFTCVTGSDLKTMLSPASQLIEMYM